jgi:hypothetical protein
MTIDQPSPMSSAAWSADLRVTLARSNGMAFSTSAEAAPVIRVLKK